MKSTWSRVTWCLVGIFLGAVGYSSHMVSKPKELSLKITKNDCWSLSEEFVALLADTFDVDVFIESGTGQGGTTASAAKYFKEVYTIEFEDWLYKRAVDRFKNASHVHVLKGDSGKLLPELLAGLREKKILFWLDGHYSGSGAGDAQSTTPIMAELDAIAKSEITDAVILVDDICCFAPPIANPPLIAQGYPSVQTLKKAIEKINNAYEFYIYGDIAIASLSSSGVTFSPLVKAFTQSRLWQADGQGDYSDVLDVEYQCAVGATQEEKAAIKDLMVEHVGREWSIYPFLWYGLLQLGEKNNDALVFFLTCIKAGYKDVRLYWYCQNALEKKPDNIKLLADFVNRKDPWLGVLKNYLDEKLPDLMRKRFKDF